jgi:hypothetical protein
MAKVTKGLDNEEYYSGNYQTEHDGQYAYRFLTLDDIINNFIVAYVGDDKIIPKARRVDISFHAMRALQELSYDTLKSILSQEIVVPASLKMMLPSDFVNYVKLTWSDASGIEHVLYPAAKTSRPIKIDQNTDGSYNFLAGDIKTSKNDKVNVIPTTSTNYSSTTPSENQKDDYNLDSDTFDLNLGQRYGIDPQHAQVNGSFFIDEVEGNIHFSSNISGKTVILKYISDGLIDENKIKDGSINVHKFAEEAMYKQIAYAILATRINTSEQLVHRFKREAFAAKRNTKLRLSNIKIEEIAQIMRGKSKNIKH